MHVAGYEGDPQALAAIKGGDQTATIADPAEWMGWEAIDELNRAFTNEPPVSGRIPFKLITKKNVPDTRGWLGDVNFPQIYKALWRVE